MSKMAWPFVAIAFLSLGLAALSYGLTIKGYAIGSVGLGRLDELDAPQLLMPLAGLHAVAAALVALLPLRGAGWVHSNMSVYLASAAVALLGVMAGLAAAKTIFVSPDMLRDLLDWRLLFGLAIVVVHLGANRLRANALIRTLAFTGLLAAALACLYWSFRL